MKPDWKDSPEWANWLAMDKDGLWFWHEEAPEPRSRDWASNGRIWQARDPLPNWLTSMEQRPCPNSN